MRENRRIGTDVFWRLVSWAGTGAILGGALVITSALLLGPAEWPDLGWPHRGLCGAVVLLAVVWALPGGEQRPVGEYDSEPGEGSGPIRVVAAPVALLALLVVIRGFSEPEGSRNVLIDLAAVSHLWLWGALALLMGAVVLAVSGRPEPRCPSSARPRLQALVAGLLPIVTLSVFVVPTVLERDRTVHTLARPLDSKTVAVSTWEHPVAESVGKADVVPTATGALVITDQGVRALDVRDGAERWRFRPVGEVLWADVDFTGDRVAVLYRDEGREEHEQRSLAVLEAETGEPVGDHRIHRQVESVLLTSTTFVEVRDTGFTVRAHDGDENEVGYLPKEDCRKSGAPVLAGPRILVPEECASEEERWYQVRMLLESGESFGTREVPGPVEELLPAPDGWSTVVHYGGDEPGSSAFQGRGSGMLGEDLPDAVVALEGERLMYAENDDDRAEYRLLKPMVARDDRKVAEPEPLESFEFTGRIPDPDTVVASAERFAAVDEEVEALLVGEWGSEPTEIPLDTVAEGFSPSGSSFGPALAPDTIVLACLTADGRAHVIGVRPSMLGAEQ